MPQIMKFDIPPARESRLRMPPGCKVLGATILSGVVENAVMTPSGKPRVEAREAAQLTVIVEYPDGDAEKIPRRLLLIAVGEKVPEGDFETVGVVAMGPVALALYLEKEKLISLVTT